VIINQALAEQLFPGQSALGQIVYAFDAEPSRVVGVVERLPSPRPGGDGAISKYTVVMPLRPAFNRGIYLIRTVDPAQRGPVMNAAVQALEQIDPKRLVRKKATLEDLREAYYRQDRSMAWLLAGVCLALLVVTAFGIVGLASFWVQQRTRMIGTRRALGASRGQILRYFQTENFLLTGVGIVLGMVGAYGTSLLLMNHYELPGLPWSYLPIGAIALWTLGQLAVLAPARRAAALPPVAALRA
jgi:putative ABC transport system permease protein